jgi:hypothetical protein
MIVLVSLSEKTRVKNFEEHCTCVRRQYNAIMGSRVIENVMEVDLFKTQYTYLKYQGETHLNNQYILSKMKDRKVKWVLSWGGNHWVWGEYKERVKEGNYGGYI